MPVLPFLCSHTTINKEGSFDLRRSDHLFPAVNMQFCSSSQLHLPPSKSVLILPTCPQIRLPATSSFLEFNFLRDSWSPGKHITGSL